MPVMASGDTKVIAHGSRVESQKSAVEVQGLFETMMSPFLYSLRLFTFYSFFCLSLATRSSGCRQLICHQKLFR